MWRSWKYEESQMSKPAYLEEMVALARECNDNTIWTLDGENHWVSQRNRKDK